AGALATLSALDHFEPVRRNFPVLAQTLRTLSNVRVRNVATVGGHLAHADPHMDLPPVLAALGAQVVVLCPSGERMLPVEELYAGYYETVLARNELIARLLVPPQGDKRASYLKVTTRAADDWPAVGIAAVLTAKGNDIARADIVLSAATERPVRLRQAEAVLRGATADEAT